MSQLVGRKVTVRVPATSANLGPGFDTLGMALSYYDELEVQAVPGTGAVVEVIGEGAGEVATDESNLVVKSIAYTFKHFGVELPGLRLRAKTSSRTVAEWVHRAQPWCRASSRPRAYSPAW